MVHDETNRILAELLIDMPFGPFPMVLGVIWCSPAATFEVAVAEQNATASVGKAADLDALLRRRPELGDRRQGLSRRLSGDRPRRWRRTADAACGRHPGDADGARGRGRRAGVHRPGQRALRAIAARGDARHRRSQRGRGRLAGGADAAVDRGRALDATKGRSAAGSAASSSISASIGAAGCAPWRRSRRRRTSRATCPIRSRPATPMPAPAASMPPWRS